MSNDDDDIADDFIINKIIPEGRKTVLCGLHGYKKREKRVNCSH